MDKDEKIFRMRQTLKLCMEMKNRIEFSIEQFDNGNEEEYHSPSFASVKRCSMDLTRELANLRK